MPLKYPSSVWDPGAVSINATYNSTTTTISDGGSAGFNLDVSGNLKTTLATAISGEDLTNDVLKVESRYTYQALTSLVTLNVKSGSGFLHSVSIGGYSGPTIEIYDSLTATGTLIGRLVNSVTPQTFIYDVTFATGLTINPQPGTGILPNITVSYR